MKDQEKKNPQHPQVGSRQISLDKEGEFPTSNRSEIDASHGEDAIEIEMNEAERLAAMDTFAPMDGQLGDESDDFEATLGNQGKNRNSYDPSLSAGGKPEESDRDKPKGIHVARAFQAGVSFKDKDSYVDEDEKDAEKVQKSNRADNWSAVDDSEDDEEN